MISQDASSRWPAKIASKVSSRGQVVVPLEFRKKLGIEEGDHLIFSLDGQGFIHLELEKKKSISQVFGALKSNKSFQPVENIRNKIYRDKATGELIEEEVD